MDKKRVRQSDTMFGVDLHCTKTNHSDRKDIYFSEIPVSVSDIKEQIQKEFSIPVCVQVLSFEGCTLGDNDRLSALRVHDGDTFRVEYLAKGDCSDLIEIISWLEELSKAMASGSSDVSNLANIKIQQRLLGKLRSCFSEWSDPTSTTYVNKLYFVDKGGLRVILKVYEFLLEKSWSQMDEDLKHLESWLIHSLWFFTQPLSPCCLLIQHNIIQMLTKSLLRVKLVEGKRILTAGHRPILQDTLGKSVEILVNLIEFPEYRLKIATNKDVLHQVSCISVAPVSIDFSLLCAMFFAYLAFTEETHKFIAEPVYMGRLFSVYRKHSDNLKVKKHLLQYHVLLYLMQVCLISPQYIRPDWYKVITSMMESFFCLHSCHDIRELEMSVGIRCQLVIPYVKLAFVPNGPQAKGPIGHLQLLSLQLALFALQNVLGRENGAELLLKEGLLDYVVCMPQYVPPSLRPQAEELVQMVVSSPDIPEGPPRLLNLVKAQLAKMHFGLEQVLSLSVSEIVSKTLPVSQGE